MLRYKTLSSFKHVCRLKRCLSGGLTPEYVTPTFANSGRPVCYTHTKDILNAFNLLKCWEVPYYFSKIFVFFGRKLMFPLPIVEFFKNCTYRACQHVFVINSKRISPCTSVFSFDCRQYCARMLFSA